MEDILRWGTQDLFQARKDSEDKQAAEPSGEPEVALANGEAGPRHSPGNTEAPKQSKVINVLFQRAYTMVVPMLQHVLIMKTKRKIL